MRNSAIYSTMIRAGRTTYFIDVNEAKNGRKYLSLSESTLGNDEKRQRATIRVSAECVDQFRQAIGEAATVASGEKTT